MIEPRITEDGTVDLLIGEIAEEFTCRTLLGENPDPEEYARRHPAQAGVLRDLLPALQAIRPDSAGKGDRPACNAVLGDFRIVREIGRGGMGVVYEAEQLSLHRRVALKVLPLAALLDERRLQRFKNEALAAAQLDHRHIVDVLGVGCERGVHYYAMRYIDGQTLAEIIESQRELDPPEREPQTPASRSGASAGVDTMPIAGFATERSATNPCRFRAAAGICRQVSEALDHAHQHGIVHRDIKPSNLIVDPKGNAWVCDFGLAHIEDSGNPLTRTGDVVGTLRFLSPEQLTSPHPVMDHRIDVFALGATLYELLTLQPAFDGATREELLRRIIAEEPTRPRKLDPRIPVELETIALKAMAKLPEDRYATARDLADDLQRFLDDKPIRARRPTLLQRVSRWSRHHKAIVRSAAVAGMICVAAMLVGSILIELARRDAVSEKTRADEQATLADNRRREAERLRALEEQNFRRALRAVDVMLTRVAQQHLADVPGMAPIRRELLEEALALYREFLAQRRHDPQVRLETLKACSRVGEIALQLGRRDQSEEAFRQLLTLAREFRQHGGDADDYRVQSAVAHHNLGVIQFARGENRKAENAYRDSLRIDGELAEKHRHDVVVRKLRGASFNNLGNVVYQRGDRNRAAELYRKAIAEYEQLAADFPAVASYRRTLATVHCSIVRHWASSGRRVEAERHCRRALGLLDELAKRRPAVTVYQRELARTHSMLGSLLRSEGRLDDAQRHMERAITMQQKLADRLASVPDFQQETARTHNNYSLLLRKTGSLEPAMRHARQALDLRKQLAADFPDKPAYRMETARSRRHLAALLIQAKSADRALEQLVQSRDELSKLVTQHGTVPLFRAELVQTLLDLGRTWGRRAELQLAEAQLRRAVELAEPIACGPSASARRRGLLADARMWRGIVMYRQKDDERAALQFRKAADGYADLAADLPGDTKHSNNRLSALQNLSLSLLRSRRFTAAEASLRETLGACATLMTSQASAGRYRSRFLGASSTLGKLLRMRGRVPRDGNDLLLMAISAWRSGEKRQARQWYDRAVAGKSQQARTNALSQRLFFEAGRLTGFSAGTTQLPVKARRPTGRRTAPP